MQLLADLQPPYEIPLLKRIMADVALLLPPQQSAWIELLRHGFLATGLTLPKAYLDRLKTLAQTVGANELQRLGDRWIAGIPQLPRLTHDEYYRRVGEWESSIGQATLLPAGINIIRALAIARPMVPAAGHAAGLEQLAQWAATTVPGAGPRSTALTSAAFRALSELPGVEGVAALGRLRGTITRASFQRVIDKEFGRAAAARGVDPEALTETTVADYALRNGAVEQTFDAYSVRLQVVEPGKSTLTWRTPAGKDQHSVPAGVKSNHAEALAELKATSKRLDSETAAQSRRIEGLWMTERSWPGAAFAKTYLAHGLLGWLARRLVWSIAEPGHEVSHAAVFADDAWRDAHGDAIDITPNATIRLWHPVTATPGERDAWAAWLTRTGFAQPFVQVHRVLHHPQASERDKSYTDGLRGRRARQSALRRATRTRGWQMGFFGGFDGGSEGAATRALPALGLSVELALKPYGEVAHNDIADGLEAGSLVFYREGRTPVALAQLPARVYSEVIREASALVA